MNSPVPCRDRETVQNSVSANLVLQADRLRNIKGAQIYGMRLETEGEGAETVFVDSRLALPEVSACQIHMLPCERRQAGKQVFGNGLACIPEDIDDTASIIVFQ
jgi:hypothetical protein